MLPFLPAALGVDTLTTGLTLGALYALIAVGLTMVYGMLRILHIAHAAILVLGAYAGFSVWQATGSFWIALPVAMAAGAVANGAIYQALYRWILEEEPLVPLIVSIGLFVALSDAYRLVFGPYSKSFAPDFAFSSPVDAIEVTQLVVLLVAAVLFAAVYLLVSRTRTGLAWQVTSQDREMAGAMGINVGRINTLNFVVGGALAGAAGALVGMYYGNISPYMGDVWAYKTFIVIVVGGLGSVPGTVIAAFLLGLFETSVISTWGYLVPRDAIAFTLMVLVLMFRPEGIMGSGENPFRTLLERVRGETTESEAEGGGE